MAWFAVIKNATGEAVSFGTTVGKDLSTGLEAVPIDHQPGEGERWEAATRSVVATPDPLASKRARLVALRAKGWAALTLAEKEEARALRFDLGGDTA